MDPMAPGNTGSAASTWPGINPVGAIVSAAADGPGSSEVALFTAAAIGVGVDAMFAVAPVWHAAIKKAKQIIQDAPVSRLVRIALPYVGVG